MVKIPGRRAQHSPASKLTTGARSHEHLVVPALCDPLSKLAAPLAQVVCNRIQRSVIRLQRSSRAAHTSERQGSCCVPPKVSRLGIPASANARMHPDAPPVDFTSLHRKPLSQPANALKTLVCCFPQSLWPSRLAASSGLCAHAVTALPRLHYGYVRLCLDTFQATGTSGIRPGNDTNGTST